MHVDHVVGHRARARSRRNVRAARSRGRRSCPGSERLKLTPDGHSRVPALRGFRREARDHDHPSGHLLGPQLVQQLEPGDLALVLVAVVAARARAPSGPSPPRYRGDRDELCAQPPVFVDFGISRRPTWRPRPRGRSCTRSRWPLIGPRARSDTAASVASSRRSTSASVCAYEKWLRFRFSGSSKIAVLHQLATVTGEQVDVVREQVVVAT